MHKSSAKIIVEPTKITAQIDCGICDLYYHMIPAHFVARRPLYGNKITVVRSPPKEKFDLNKAIKFANRTIEFEYDGFINYQQPYFYIDCWSPEISEIRKLLGLPKFRNGFKSYHITIGNVKP